MDDVSGDERRMRRSRVWSADCGWSKVTAEDVGEKPLQCGVDTGTQEHTAFSGIAGIGVV